MRDSPEIGGLEDVVHEGPSTIGIDSLIISEGQIPELFLLGAGVSDSVIQYARSLASRPPEIGDKFRESIDQSIRTYDKLLVILSAASISSAWVEAEVEAVFEKEQRISRAVLFPIRVDDSAMKTDAAWAAQIRRTRHIGDFSNWEQRDSYAKAFDRLMRDLRSVETDRKQ